MSLASGEGDHFSIVCDVVLADNVPAYRIEVTPFEAGKSETWLPALGQIIALTPEDIARFEDERRAMFFL